MLLSLSKQGFSELGKNKQLLIAIVVKPRYRTIPIVWFLFWNAKGLTSLNLRFRAPAGAIQQFVAQHMFHHLQSVEQNILNQQSFHYPTLELLHKYIS